MKSNTERSAERPGEVPDFEKLGVFYLGREAHSDTPDADPPLTLYDSRDLTTHAVIIGMTGSGKTGLGISLLEEAAIDRIPVIAIDPKGDLGNLLLGFPSLRAQKFKPWVDPNEAKRKGLTLEELARSKAELWRNGLAQWGQSSARIQKMRDAAEPAIFTPGSSAGIPISVVKSFECPPDTLMADKDLYRERIAATATSILALMRIDADPVGSREHILLATILEHTWDAGRDIDIPGLINAIQNPAFERIGVMDVDSFYPAKDRFALAMKLNGLLASPGFEAWMEGVPLDGQRLFYTDSGKPRVSVISIAHLPDSERMFFVTMLLNEILSWMRAQPGTGSLRAVLYMDEIFGYMPPIANPPSKLLLLTLLKQARAYGLGLVLATQNPVDLDYKGLSNTGTWFIGRLQTERDQQRVIHGLEGGESEIPFDRDRMSRQLAGLGSRKFLLHNVHEDRDIVFQTRWALSYLAGPLTRTQIKTLMAPSRKRIQAPEPARRKTSSIREKADGTTPPVLPPGVTQYFLPSATPSVEAGSRVYKAFLLGVADAVYSNARYGVNKRDAVMRLVSIEEGAIAVDWASGEDLEFSTDDLLAAPVVESSFVSLPKPASNAKHYVQWARDMKRWIRSERSLVIYRSPSLKLNSQPDESEGEFRARLQITANEKRDIKAEALRKKYQRKLDTLEARLLRAEQAVERERDQASHSRLDTMVAVGSAVLGAFLGRKAVSRSTATGVGSAIRKASRVRKEGEDVARAERTVAHVQQTIAALEAEFEQDLAALSEQFDSQLETLEERAIKANARETHVHFVALAWVPYTKGPGGRLYAA